MTDRIWMYKLIGTVILLTASMVYGRKKILDERRKIREAEALRDLTEHIAEQIEYTMKPLPEIIAGFENGILREIGFLETAGTYGIREAWKMCQWKFCLPEGNIRSAFGEFCREIGRGYRKEELELCGLTLKRLRSEIERMKGDSGNCEKLYRTIPPLMVLSVVLILL